MPEAALKKLKEAFIEAGAPSAVERRQHLD